MAVEDDLVRAALGPEAELFDFELEGASHRGWRRWFVEVDEAKHAHRLVKDHWKQFHNRDIRLFVGARKFKIGENDYTDAISAAGRDDLPEVLTSALPVYALPGRSMIDVLNFANVGSHNDPAAFLDAFESMGELSPELQGFKALLHNLPSPSGDLPGTVDAEPSKSQPERVVDALGAVERICPFAIQFADPAGLHATFLRRIGESEAEGIADMLLRVAPESAEVVSQRLERMGYDVDISDAMPEYIVRTRRFRLWWD